MSMLDKLSEDVNPDAAETRKSELVEGALALAERGWRIVILYSSIDGVCTCHRGKQCASPGKHPRFSEWQHKASSDEATVQGWFDRWPDSNVGVKLGSDSGIIDIECDSREAERDLAALFDNDFPVVPTFQAGRGKHRIFRWSDDLPEKDKGVFWHGDSKIEFRTGNGAKGAQSVFPPSMHASGKEYQWLVSPDEADLIEIPPAVLERLRQGLGGAQRKAKAKDYSRIAQGVAEGSRVVDMMSLIGSMLAGVDTQNAASLETIYLGVEAINSRHNPPLAAAELRDKFDSVIDRERSKPITVDPAIDGDPYDLKRYSSDAEDGWRIEIVLSQPQTYRLYSPYFFGKGKGYVGIASTEDLCNPKRIVQAGIEQLQVPIPKRSVFCDRWLGNRKYDDLVDALLPKATKIEAPLEAKRDAVVAGYFYDSMTRAFDAGEDQEPSPNGHPVRMVDDRIVFQYERIWERVAQSPDKITRPELAGIMKQVGCTEKRYEIQWKYRRYRVLGPSGLELLEKLAGVGDDVETIVAGPTGY